ncbi:methionyl-tRNA formyltransferase [Chitinophaga barathri]|uniref:Methionyl-tRNA formyltransferase n=1 Tax=Chitinophaga barathri TaxID=1647451 RepID=A0A3N4M9N3_9BACT|nr:methionyl-tRNA formyltransferase [Chitinophaga barathri]RPD38037.1 methionyl-tRNA formyltransferase [Chitinophaga barathri]
MRIIFMGTPEFAVASLDALVQHGYEVVAVITAPDKPAGRGLQLQQSAVKQYAVEKNIPVLQPEKLKNPAFLEELKSYNADLQVVVAFRMLPEVVWNMPRLGTVNVHASLLPQYRGAAPINWAVINGEKESGVTTFRLQHEIDTGNILYASKVPIREDETAGELYDTLMKEGAKVLIRTVTSLEKGDISGTVQNNIPPEELKHAPKIFKEDCRINWENPVENIYNLIRGLSPYPTAFTTLQDKTLKIFKAEKETTQHTHAPGSVHTDQKTFLKFAAPGGYIHLVDIQLEGKKRMGVVEFLRGFRF